MPEVPQQFNALVTPLGQNIVDDSADAIPTMPVGNSGGRVSLTDITVTSSTAITSSGTVNLASITNPGARGAMFYLDVDSATSSAAASPTLDIRLQAKDPVSSAWFNIPDASFAQVTTATSAQVLLVHPTTVSDSGSSYRRTSSPLPVTYRVQHVTGSLSSGSTGATYEFTIGATYIP